MTDENLLSIKAVRETAEKKASRLQPWQGYFELRSLEIEALMHHVSGDLGASMLEIGCGNGYNAALLSRRARSMIATDLFLKSVETHTQGVAVAGELIKSLGAKSCKLVSCSGEALPFKDGSFDIVFSLYTMEHVPHKDAMAREIKRVLKPGGKAYILVPNFVERIFYPLVFYRDMISRGVSKLVKKFFRNTRSSVKKSDIYGLDLLERDTSTFKAFRKAYPHFPFPEPHGAYLTYGHEVVGYMPLTWRRIFAKEGLSVKEVCTTIAIPWEILSFIHPALPLKVYRRTLGLNIRLGRILPFKYFGNNVCLVLEKI